jgi:hypothetical protein
MNLSFSRHFKLSGLSNRNLLPTSYGSKSVESFLSITVTYWQPSYEAKQFEYPLVSIKQETLQIYCFLCSEEKKKHIFQLMLILVICHHRFTIEIKGLIIIPAECS